MQYEIIGWTNYCDPDYVAVEEPKDIAYLTTTVIKEIRKHGYRFTGDYHSNETGYVPVFNSGEKFCVSYRQWGAIMAQALREDNRDGMAYTKWFNSWEHNASSFVFPELTVDKSRIVKGVKPEFEPLLDEEYYSTTPKNMEAMMKEFAEFVKNNNVKTISPQIKRKK